MTALGRILFSSVVIVLDFQPGGPGSTPVRTLHFFHAFVHLFLCYVLCSQDGSSSGIGQRAINPI